MDTNHAFGQGLDQLIGEHPICIDRPHMSKHPRWPDKVYPLDYGYLAEITAIDGEGLDIWLGEGGERRISGIICAVDLLKHDVEVKLLIGCTGEEMAQILAFMDDGDLHPLLISGLTDGCSQVK